MWWCSSRIHSEMKVTLKHKGFYSTNSEEWSESWWICSSYVMKTYLHSVIIPSVPKIPVSCTYCLLSTCYLAKKIDVELWTARCLGVHAKENGLPGYCSGCKIHCRMTSRVSCLKVWSERCTKMAWVKEM